MCLGRALHVHLYCMARSQTVQTDVTFNHLGMQWHSDAETELQEEISSV